jgi:hypothetical protein
VTITGSDSYETFVNNSLVVKAFPMAVMGLLCLNLIFNLFLWVLEIKFGQILLKTKLIFSTLSAKSSQSVSQNAKVNDEMESIGSTQNQTQTEK